MLTGVSDTLLGFFLQYLFLFMSLFLPRRRNKEGKKEGSRPRHFHSSQLARGIRNRKVRGKSEKKSFPGTPGTLGTLARYQVLTFRISHFMFTLCVSCFSLLPYSPMHSSQKLKSVRHHPPNRKSKQTPSSPISSQSVFSM